MPYIIAVFVLLLLTAAALNTMPFLAIPPVLLVALVIKLAPKDAIDNFFAYCGAAGLLAGLITLAKHFL